MRTPDTVDVLGAADLLKIHPKTVLDLIATGELPAAKVGRAYVMLTRDILEHIQNAIYNQTAERLIASGRRNQARPQRKMRIGSVT